MTHGFPAIGAVACRIPTGEVTLEGDLVIPNHAGAVVAFAHGSGSSRHSPRNRYVAERLQQAGLATLLLDLLTTEEEAADQHTGHLRFDLELLAERLVGATDWLHAHPKTSQLPIGYFGASTGGGAALVAATRRVDRVRAVVSRGGRPDLALASLGAVRAATLLIVGGNDTPVIRLNETALHELRTPHRQLVVVPGASHLFEEPGKLDEVARLAAEWFLRYLPDDLPEPID